MGQLWKLSLHNNNLHHIDLCALRKIPAFLRHLDLSYNQIEKLMLRDMTDLVENNFLIIDLSNNNISEIDFRPATDLEPISDQLSFLSSSQEHSSAPNILPKLAQKVYIMIKNNPIKCDCFLHDFIHYLRGESNTKILSRINVEAGLNTCISPSNLEGVLLTNLVPQELTCILEHVTSGEKCPEQCTCNVRLYDSAFVVNCSYSSVSSMPTLPNITRLTLNYSRIKTINHTELHMEGNHITSLVKKVNDANVNNISKLFLANNNITGLGFFNVFKDIEFLDLRNNSIEYVNSSVTDLLTKSTSLKQLWLSGNPIECECRNMEFFLFTLIEYNKIQDFTAIKCSKNLNFTIVNLTLTIANLCGAPLIKNSNYSLVTIVVTILLAITGIVIALCCKFNNEIKVFFITGSWLFSMCGEEELDKEKDYDVFISFSQKDEDFVVNQLMPELEKGPHPFKICIHFRNWVAGEFIPAQIARSVRESRRTIIVLSPNFLESVWGKMEFRVAHSSALKEGRTRVIVILYGDIGATDKLDLELQAYLSTNTYVKWGDPWFWRKLRYALPHPSSKNRLISNAVKRKRYLEDKLELSVRPEYSAGPSSAHAIM